jgi:hypothetical protein
VDTVWVIVTCVAEDIVLDSCVPSFDSQYSVVGVVELSSDIWTVKFHGLGAPRPEPHVLVPSAPATL